MAMPTPPNSGVNTTEMPETSNPATDSSVSFGPGTEHNPQSDLSTNLETAPCDAPPESMHDIPVQGESASASSKTEEQNGKQAPSGPRSRLVIHKMVLFNFKSYAGRQEIGPFHKSFSAIVGPNGSGKSNTIDALLFVFGYRASKMRQGKLSELIHNSARFPDLKECSVEVHFREIVDQPGPDAYSVVPSSELTVSRTAFRNNSSNYYINKRSSNFTEVTTLLKRRGIDLDHKRFLILQGEVESIAQMKPKAPSEHEDGLLEYLEDIIGTSQYKEPIEATLLEVDKHNEDRGQKLNRLRLVEKEKNALEDAKRETEDYLRLQNDLVREQSRSYQWYIWQASSKSVVLEKDIENLQHQLNSEMDQNKDDISHAEQLQEHYDERVATYEEIKQQSDEVMTLLAGHQKQEVGLSEKRKHVSAKVKKAKKTIQEDEHRQAEARHSIRDNGRIMEEEKKKITEFESALEKEEGTLDEIREGLKDKTQVFHDQIEVKQKELEPWTAKINSCQSVLDIAKGEREMIANKVDNVKKAVAESEQTLEVLRAEKSAKEQDTSKLKLDRTAAQTRSRSLTEQVTELKAFQHSIRTKAAASRSKVEEAKANQAASHSQNAVLDSLSRLKQSGRIDGFHGRLGSLGTIPEDYDVAVSTACGSLNHLVVDTVEQGQSCIEYLRRQNIGRASFMVLDKIAPTGLDRISTPENVPRLFDLIEPKEPRFGPAFFKAIGNTLVAKDMEQANRIAFGGQKRWRVVTLAGQLIDISGTMTGGGNKILKGGMSSSLDSDLVDPAALRRYEKESAELERQLQEATDGLKHAEEELEELAAKQPQVDIELQKVELNLETLRRRVEEAEKRAAELQSHSKPDAGDLGRMRELEKDIAKANAELQSLQAKSGSVERAITALEQKILDVGGSKMLAQKSKVDGIKLHINLASDEITRAEVTKAKCEKDVEKFAASLQENARALVDLEEHIADIDGQLEECLATVNEIESKVELAQSATDNAKEDLDGIKSELDDQLKVIQKFRAKEMDIQQKLTERKKEFSECERVVQNYSGLHGKLSLEDVDDDEEEEQHNTTENPGGDSIKPKEQPESNHGLPVYTPEELSAYDKKTLLANIGFLEEKLQNAKVDLNVLKEYRKREAEFLARAQDLERVTGLRDATKKKYDDLRKTRLEEFMSGFNTISSKLKEMYQMITLGGNAELELVDSMDPFSEGIIFSVMPPKKSWKNISNLSGGEKTLSSLALVFALHVFKPTPLYFMDEIDAALDFRNVSIVANYIKDRTKNAQFIIISLRNDMFELSHRLVGIYKTANATQSVAIDNRPLNAVPVL